nr:uncharacterized protein LOC105498868 isoform X2 [Macaca nemestrina]
MCSLALLPWDNTTSRPSANASTMLLDLPFFRTGCRSLLGVYSRLWSPRSLPHLEVSPVETAEQQRWLPAPSSGSSIPEDNFKWPVFNFTG